MRHRSSPFVLVLCALGACSAASTRQGGTEPVLGEWGGPRVGLSLTPTGGVIRYDCAHGSLSAPVIADDAGRFDVRGFHVREHGGPVRIGEIPDSVPARYVGQVDGPHMSLHVTVGPDMLGPYLLQLAAPAQLVRCL